MARYAKSDVGERRTASLCLQLTPSERAKLETGAAADRRSRINRRRVPAGSSRSEESPARIYCERSGTGGADAGRYPVAAPAGWRRGGRRQLKDNVVFCEC